MSPCSSAWGRRSRRRGSLDEAGRQGLVDVLARYAVLAVESGADQTTFVGTEPLRRLADASRIVHDVVPRDRSAPPRPEPRGGGVPRADRRHRRPAGGARPPRRRRRWGEQRGRPRRAGAASRRRGAAGRGDAAHRRSSLPAIHPARTSWRLFAPRRARPWPRRRRSGRPRSSSSAARPRTCSKSFRAARIRGASGRPTSRRRSGSLQREPSEAIAARHGLRPARARILGAGAAIVEAIMLRYGVTEVRVADGGIREGTILAVAHAGAALARPAGAPRARLGNRTGVGR